MRYLLLALPIALAACDTVAIPQLTAADPGKSVEVLGRKWTVAQISEEPVYYRAIRDQTEFFMFGPPPRIKTSQAIQAIESATGCRVNRSTMYRDVSDYFYTQVICS